MMDNSRVYLHKYSSNYKHMWHHLHIKSSVDGVGFMPQVHQHTAVAGMDDDHRCCFASARGLRWRRSTVGAHTACLLLS